METTAPAAAPVVLGPDGEPLSKNALKKAQKAKEAEDLTKESEMTKMSTTTFDKVWEL